MYRIVFLILGAVLLASASTLSQSLAFYYSSAMAVGIMLVVLLVLFQVALSCCVNFNILKKGIHFRTQLL